MFKFNISEHNDLKICRFVKKMKFWKLFRGFNYGTSRIKNNACGQPTSFSPIVELIKIDFSSVLKKTES